MRRLGLVLLFAITALTTAPSFADDTRDIGGQGGGWFRDECHPGDVLVGVNTLAGKDLNTVGPVCRPMVDGRIVDQPYGLNTWGRRPDDDTGTSPGQPWCYGDNGVFSIHATFSASNTVHSFSLGCRDVVTGAESDSILSATHGGKGGNAEVVGCQPGMIATGLKGRSGSLIDALGLICSPIPGAKPRQAQQQPQPSGPPQKPIKSTARGGQNNAPAQTNGPNLEATNGGAGGNGNNGGGTGGRATASVDTTIYDQPGGNDIAYLSAGDRVTIVSCNDDDWCELSAPQAGWVWGEDIDR